MSERADDDVAIGFLTHIPVWVLLATVALYVIGWSYLYGYYSSFGVSVSALGFELPQMLASASPVIMRPIVAQATVLAVALVITLPLLLRRHGKARKTARRVTGSVEEGREKSLGAWPVMAFVGLALGMFALEGASYWAVAVGHARAAHDMRETETTLPQARVTVDRQMLSQEAFPDASKQDYRLLLHGRSGYYLFQPIKDVEGLAPGYISVIFVPDKAVVSAEISSLALNLKEAK